MDRAWLPYLGSEFFAHHTGTLDGGITPKAGTTSLPLDPQPSAHCLQGELLRSHSLNKCLNSTALPIRRWVQSGGGTCSSYMAREDPGPWPPSPLLSHTLQLSTPHLAKPSLHMGAFLLFFFWLLFWFLFCWVFVCVWLLFGGIVSSFNILVGDLAALESVPRSVGPQSHELTL